MDAAIDAARNCAPNAAAQPAYPRQPEAISGPAAPAPGLAASSFACRLRAAQLTGPNGPNVSSGPNVPAENPAPPAQVASPALLAPLAPLAQAAATAAPGAGAPDQWGGGALARKSAYRVYAFNIAADAEATKSLADASVPVAKKRSPAEQVLGAARELLGKPYQRGGETPHAGFDCSGFTSYVYGQAGLDLPRRSGEQFAEGRAIPASELRAGDLVFFGDKNRIAHVGIYAGGGKFIHSGSDTGHVKISDLEYHYWKNRLAGCRRVLPREK